MALRFTILLMPTRTCKLALLAAISAFAGCAQQYPPAILPSGGEEPSGLNYDDLAQVLDGLLTRNGMLLSEVLKRRVETLDRQLWVMYAFGPDASPSQFASADDELAYWYNARAAWAMKLTIMCNCSLNLSPGELTERRFPLNGQMMTLDEIDGRIASLGDWRVLAAAPGVTLARARLPDTPFVGSDVRRRIDERVGQLLDDDQRFVIDIAHERVIVPQIVWRCRREIIAEYDSTYGASGATLTTALLPYAGRGATRRLQDAVGYDIVPADSFRPTALLEDAWKLAL
jgi:hypothetical protein